MKIPQLPPHIQQQIHEFLHLAHEAFAPLFGAVARTGRQLFAARGTSTLGSTFRNICIVGLNRTELLFAGENEGVFGDSWQELIDESMRRHLALIFFAPRGLDGQPVNPYLFLAGEQLASEEGEGADATTFALAQQLVGNIPLLDFCRLSPAQPNTLNVLVAADTLFHWDVKDNYVLPTTPSSWARDLDDVLRGYPRTTRAHVYTQWDADMLPSSDRITIHPVRDLPLDNNTWINKPTIQEAYGNHVLALGIAAAFLTALLLYWNQQSLNELNEQLRVIEQQIPREGRFGDMERAVREQEKMMQRRQLFYLATKDAARTAQSSQMKLDNFEVRVPDVQEVPKQYLVTFEATKDAYNGWLQEEPIAKSILTNSVLLEGVRKPPATTFKLEGLITLDKAWKKYAPFANREQAADKAAKAKSAQTASATEVVQ